MEIIEQLEPHRRNVYCGNIGYISFCGTMDTNITIRTLLTEKGKMYCWAGGAIVADSEEQAEYQETLDKINRILPQLKNTIEIDCSVLSDEIDPPHLSFIDDKMANERDY